MYVGKFMYDTEKGGAGMIKKIGITGPSGSGKSILSDHLRRAGIPTIDADKLYHSMLVPPSRCLDAISSVFGKDILTSDGRIDRSVLSSKVFSDDKQLKLLNDTVLPIVIDEIKSEISKLEESGEEVVAIDAPTLIESGFHKECDLTVSVISSRQTRISRISARDNISEAKAKERIDAQHGDDFYILASDRVIINDSDRLTFEKQANELISLIRSI